MRIVGAIGVGLMVAAVIAFEATVGEGPADPEAGLLAGLFAGVAVYDLCAGIIAYLAPLWIALGRGHPETAAIAAVNLLLGWTVLGWLIAMVWAFSRVPGKADAPHSSGFGWSEQHPCGRSGR